MDMNTIGAIACLLAAVAALVLRKRGKEGKLENENS